MLVMTQRTRLPLLILLDKSVAKKTGYIVKKEIVSSQVNAAPSSVLEWVDSPNVYAAARAERARYVRGFFSNLFGRKSSDAAAPNADGLAPLGMTA